MRTTVLLAGLALAFLAGCSSLPRDSGFEVRTVQAEGRQEPWQNRAINREAFVPTGVAVVYVTLPQPIPEKWKREFVDPDRIYTVPDGPRKLRKPLVRAVFRAVAFFGPGQTETYDAVVDQEARGFMVFVPLVDAERIRGQSLLILSSDGKWGMTTLGAFVEFETGFAPDRLSVGFFATRPSPVRQVIRVKPDQHDGRTYLSTDEVLGKKVAETVATFSLPFWLRGQAASYLGKPDIATVLAEFTSVDGVPDRLISCTSLKLGPGSASALPIVAAVYGVQAGIALAKEDCKK